MSQENPLNDSGDLSFVFIESQFLTAIKMGYWVLLDNVNSAPPEVIERINSLLEEEPTLNIYEHHDGDELSYANKSIHKNFCIFSTANTQRESSNKLSSAFLNRVIRIWLPKMDEGLHEYVTQDDKIIDDKIKNNEIYNISKIILEKICANKSSLALLLTKYHAIYQNMIRMKEISLGENTELTFRKILKTLELFDFTIRSGEGLLNALVYSIEENYVSPLNSKLYKKSAIRKLLELIKVSNVNDSVITSNYKQEFEKKESSSNIDEYMIKIEGALTIVTFNSFLRVDLAEKNNKNVYNCISNNFVLFLSQILIPINENF